MQSIFAAAFQWFGGFHLLTASQILFVVFSEHYGTALQLKSRITVLEIHYHRIIFKIILQATGYTDSLF